MVQDESSEQQLLTPAHHKMILFYVFCHILQVPNPFSLDSAHLFLFVLFLQNLKLRYKSRFPNFFEVYIKKPDTDFTLSLAQKNECQSVWTREIRKGEFSIIPQELIYTATLF